MDANVRKGRRVKQEQTSGAYDALNYNIELQLLPFGTYHGLAIVNVFFATPKDRVSHTFNGRGKKRTDYMLTRQRHRNLVRERNDTPPAFLPKSDHNTRVHPCQAPRPYCS